MQTRDARAYIHRFYYYYMMKTIHSIIQLTLVVDEENQREVVFELYLSKYNLFLLRKKPRNGMRIARLLTIEPITN